MTLGRVLYAMLAAMLLALPSFSPIRAAADEPLVQVSIHSVSTPRIDITDVTQSIEVTGTLLNTATRSISALSVHFFRNTSALTSSDELSSALAEPTGTRLSNEETGNLVHPLEGDLQPGQQVSFTLRATVEELGFRTAESAYLIGADVRGVPEGEARQSLGRAVTAIAATSSPTTSSTLVLLTAQPNRLPNGKFLDDSLTEELSGRLTTLATSAERPGVVAAIDPALYDAVTALTESHILDGENREPDDVAVRWLRRVDALAAAGKLWRLPYGNPNLGTAQASGKLDAVLAWAESASDSLPTLPRVALLDAQPDDTMTQALSSFDTLIVVGATGSTTGQPQVLGASAQATLAKMPLEQRLARELVAEQPTLYVIATAAEAAADLTDLSLRAHAAPEAKGDVDFTWPAVSPVPWSTVASALDEARQQAILTEDLTRTSVDLSVLGATAFSASFVDESAALAYVTLASPPSIDLTSLTLVASQSFVMGSRSNTFPATLTNASRVSATVRVEFTSEAPQRIWVPTLEKVTIDPGQSLTLNISPEASANGVTVVHAQLYTLSGRAIGEPIAIEITATDLGRVGWAIIAVSGLIVLGGTAWRIRAVRRERTKEATG